MKILAFEVRQDEVFFFHEMEQKYHLDLTLTSEVLSMKNVSMIAGYDAVTILGMNTYGEHMLDAIKAQGCYYLSTRTIGYNHIDVEHAKKIGMHICNAAYAPNSVADFTLMLMLLALRKYKPAVYRQNVNDYSLNGLIGKTMDSMTVGVIGTGRIGASVIRHLHGFDCRILAADEYQNEEVKKYADYVDRETLMKEADMITFHLPLTEQTYHMVNEDSLQKMKDGVILVNTARGELMDIQALIHGIEAEKIGALAMDVIEHENNIYHESHVNDIISNRDMAYIRQFPNVILTQHMAFYTESAVQEMVTCGIEGLVTMLEGKKFRLELTSICASCS